MRKSSFSPEFPATLSVIIFLTILLAYEDVFNDLIIIFVPLSVFVAAYIFQIFYGRSFAKSPRFTICNKCYNEDSIGRKECGCGGKFESPDFFNFIEETEENQEQI